ncbi:MAG: alpha/beta hydrolase [Christensenellales bacterium]
MHETDFEPGRHVALWKKEQIPYFREEMGQQPPYLACYTLPEGKPKGAVIVIPGGAYGGMADHEGAPVARKLNEAGIAAFVLSYRVAPYRFPVPQTDLTRAIRFVRANAFVYNVDPEAIGVLGFSAGGHLAGCAGTFFDEGDPEAADPVERVSSRPDTQVLCYPVITFGNYTHAGSVENLVGSRAPAKLLQQLSLHLQVTENTPPTFLWHTANDEAVPVENSIFMAASLSLKKVPFELHIFPEGRHGLGLAEDNAQARAWFPLCVAWLKQMGF